MTDTFAAGAPVMVWQGKGLLALPGGIATGARVTPEVAQVLGDPPPGRVWLDLCTMGQHLPQMYLAEEVIPLDRATAERHGMCGDCLGYGTTGEVALAMGSDELPQPCGTCAGSGRPAVEVEISRSPGSTVGKMRFKPHPPVLIDGRDDCMACGLVPGQGPEGMENHTA